MVANKQVNSTDGVYMYYEIRCEGTDELKKLVTRNMLILCEKYKDNEKIFPKREDKEKSTN